MNTKPESEKQDNNLNELGLLSDIDLAAVGKWVWIMIGCSALIASAAIFFGDPLIDENISKEHVSIFFFILGLGVLINVFVVTPIRNRISNRRSEK